ncbi:AsmA family protein [Sphingobium phenoxybenzoativorans]|uniref:AsmA family protein n=1 Tax=Sphingobium phenoxybenzoativorans TaxID=1592790 RepID=UPI0009F3016F|nr:AsmA family protein [Sphingobium phenoxybenzoativorans]
MAMTTGPGGSQQRWIVWSVMALGALTALMLAILAAFPLAVLKGPIEALLENSLGAKVSIGRIERREWLSLAPTIFIDDLAVAQPPWAGQGKMVRARRVEARVPILASLASGGVQTDSLVAHGLKLDLIRDVNGRSNWEGRETAAGPSHKPNLLTKLVISEGQLSLRDDKRSLGLKGSLVSDERGLRIEARGHFHNAPATFLLSGGRLMDRAGSETYPIRVEMASSLLNLVARGRMNGPLNSRSMALDIHAKAPSLQYLDDIIEAGLFGSRPIDFTAKVRHENRDWFVDRLRGRIGRSPLDARASVLKRDGRSKIDAVVHFAALDFDDLSDMKGQAEARAIEAKIGQRVIPDTRINISKVGPTDGIIKFRADKLLLQNSAFRSLKGVISLESKLLKVSNIVADMSSGHMRGNLQIDQRGNVKHPRLSIDLAFENGRLETLVGSTDVTGPLRGRVKLSGVGDTIREALSRSDGRAGLLVKDGTIKRIFAAVLGQDLGRAIGTALKERDADVPLRCLAVAFDAKSGVMTPSPFIVDTAISTGEGRGTISLASERIALTIRSRSKDPSALRLVDPIAVGGSFSAPTLSAAGTPPGSKITPGSVLKAFGKSIGQSLGMGKKDQTSVQKAPAVKDCDALARHIL